jgi:hypothetical protein
MKKIENILHMNSANLLRNSKSTTTFKQRKENGGEKKKKLCSRRFMSKENRGI